MDARKVLIVDDEALVRDALTLIMEERGYDVYQAENGLTGMSVALSVHPDVIISDFLMPGMDGLSFLQCIKGVPSLAPAKVLVISGVGDPTVGGRCLRSGADAYLDKNAGVSELLATIDSVTNGAG